MRQSSAKKRFQNLLENTRSAWDRPGTRPAIRENFSKVIRCGTASLGAEVFSSDTETKLVYHTCKSRACPSCGHRATRAWQRDREADLPDISYVGVTLTMPGALWPLFQKNRHLLHDLPVLGAKSVQQWARHRHGVNVLLMVIGQTFGCRLNFNSHLHIMVSVGGLSRLDGTWIGGLVPTARDIEPIWRFAVIHHLREAMRAKILAAKYDDDELVDLLNGHFHRGPWSVDVTPCQKKTHLIEYAGRYIRRPPIALGRIKQIMDGRVHYWRKDTMLKKNMLTLYPLKRYVSLVGEHVPDRYEHAMRYFGLLAPRTKRHTSAALFALIDQHRRPRPPHLSWAESIQRAFGVDPLLDSSGKPMRWSGRRRAYTQ